MGGCKLGALAACVAISAAASAHAAVEVIDFEDGVVGSPYPFSGEAPQVSSTGGVVATDGSGKSLRLNNGDVWFWTGPSTVGPDGVKTAHNARVTSLDVFLTAGSWLYAHGGRQDVVRGSWQHVDLLYQSDFGTYLSILGDGYVDNITYDDVSSSRFVPEPATWAMMIAGFGMVGGALRRRRIALA